MALSGKATWMLCSGCVGELDWEAEAAPALAIPTVAPSRIVTARGDATLLMPRLEGGRPEGRAKGGKDGKL